MWPLALKYGPYAIALALGIAIGVGIHRSLSERRYATLERDFTTYKLEQANAISKAHIAADIERERLFQTAQDLENAARENEAKNAAAVADLHAKYDRLRITKARACSAASVPEAGHSALAPGPAPGRELLDADGRSFVEIAADAERVRQQLITCQAWAESLR